MDRIKKFLLVRFSSIGDIIFTSFIPTKIKEIYPLSRVDFLTLTNFASLLEHHPHIDRIISIDKNTGISDLKKLVHELDNENYEMMIDTHNSLRSKLLRCFSKSDQWKVYRKERWKRFLLFYLHINRFPNNNYISNTYTQGNNSGDIKDMQSLNISISFEEKKRSKILFDGKKRRKDYIVIVPGAAWKEKKWLPENYIKIANYLIQKGLDIIMLGGNSDAICDEIAHGASDVINLKGKTDLRMSLAILSDAKLVIGGDTGLIHGAEAVNTPVIMITGPTTVDTGATIVHPNSIQIGLNLWCRPCSKNGSRPCYRKDQFCMTGITPQMVLNRVQKYLN